ncbi:hypothetical protein BofuT4_P091860.1 [Botrytis cinerea T4]|uniref:Uncharacterized protein n=1 Tax=Botryotinia fuckeliana (strain T4) TaxID=999810 RepID=G2YEM9_BOTF4|nr:hypothetical protein BofuT4_P091860.1 [Botrytis cinerea T4]
MTIDYLHKPPLCSTHHPPQRSTPNLPINLPLLPSIPHTSFTHPSHPPTHHPPRIPSFTSLPLPVKQMQEIIHSLSPLPPPKL